MSCLKSTACPIAIINILNQIPHAGLVHIVIGIMMNDIIIIIVEDEKKDTLQNGTKFSTQSKHEAICIDGFRDFVQTC